MGYYGRYVDRLSAAHGAGAFFAWLLGTIALQFAGTFLAVPVVLLAKLAPEPMQASLNAWLFLLCFFALRFAICVVPVYRAAGRKARGPWMWAGWTVVFGQLALAVLAALPRAEGAKA